MLQPYPDADETALGIGGLDVGVPRVNLPRCALNENSAPKCHIVP